MSFRTAAIAYGPDDDVDAVLAACIQDWQACGRAVSGFLQRFGERIGTKRAMMLEVVPTGELLRLNDPRGPGVQGCILDTDALAGAAMRFRDMTLTKPDLLVAGRFGKQEAAGEGMRAEMAEALLAGIPLLVPMRPDYLTAWSEFLGQPSEVLPPRRESLMAWVETNCTASAPRTAAIAAALGW